MNNKKNTNMHVLFHFKSLQVHLVAQKDKIQ